MRLVNGEKKCYVDNKLVREETLKGTCIFEIVVSTGIEANKTPHILFGNARKEGQSGETFFYAIFDIINIRLLKI